MSCSMQVQPGNLYCWNPVYLTDRICDFIRIIAKPKTAVIILSVRIFRRYPGNIDIQPNPYFIRLWFGRQFLQPIDLPFGLDIDNRTACQCVQERISVFHRAVIDDPFSRKTAT